jgi:type I restriction enzyme S subunit
MTFHLLRVRVNPNKCDPKYLQMVFEGASHIRRQTRDASIGSTRAGFNTRLLAELDIPVPPRHEQHRIVEEVERRLSVVEAMEKSVVSGLARGERMRQAILRKAFAGELVPQDPNDEPASTLLKRIRAERIAVSPPKGLRKHRPAVTQLELVDQ